MTQPFAPGTAIVLSNGDTRNALVAAECQALTGVLPRAGMACGGATAAVWRSAYQQYGLRVIASAAGQHQLCVQVAALLVALDQFHIKVIAPGASGRHRQAMGLAVAEAIQADPNLSAPLHRLLLLVEPGRWTLASIMAEPDRGYLLHDQKLLRTSSSLPSRLARGLVNLLPVGSRTLLDPCCGSGSIPLEASALGLQVYCGDSNPKMAGMTRQNLDQFGYTAEVVHRDARDWRQAVDAVVTDLPYGRHCYLADDVMQGIFANAARLAPVGIFVAGENLASQMAIAGYARVEVLAVPKGKQFQRYVHLGWSNVAVDRRAQVNKS